MKKDKAKAILSILRAGIGVNIICGNKNPDLKLVRKIINNTIEKLETESDIEKLMTETFETINPLLEKAANEKDNV